MLEFFPIKSSLRLTSFQPHRNLWQSTKFSTETTTITGTKVSPCTLSSYFSKVLETHLLYVIKVYLYDSITTYFIQPPKRNTLRDTLVPKQQNSRDGPRSRSRSQSVRVIYTELKYLLGPIFECPLWTTFIKRLVLICELSQPFSKSIRNRASHQSPI